MMPSDDIFKSIRDAVSQTLEMAEADSKISEETKDILAELSLTRRSDGEVMLDITALEKMKAAENQWVDDKKNHNDNLVNPTRLPQLVPGVHGLQSSQYLAFVQRPLELNGDNGPFLERKSLKIYEQFQAKELVKERNQTFGHYQRFIAKIMIDEVLKLENSDADQAAIDNLRTTMPAQEQFAIASKRLGVSSGEVMNRLFKYAVALYTIEGIKSKALRLEQAKPVFENALKKMASEDIGPTSKTRMKELFLGFQTDLGKMLTMAKTFNQNLVPIVEKSKGDHFDQSYSNLHRQAAQLDAMITRWVIIIGEANTQKSARATVDRIKGMHIVYKG